MRFVVLKRGETGARRHRQAAARSRNRGNAIGRRRQRRNEHQATGAATLGADFAVAFAGRGRGLVAGERMTDGRSRAAGLGRRRARDVETSNEAGKRNRISRGERHEAPPQGPLGEVSAQGNSPLRTIRQKVS